MATSSISPPFPEEQPQDAVPNPATVMSSTSSAWQSSGSIGPFFAVISVLTVLAIISCVLGRMCRGRKLTPLESIRYRGCFGWFRRKCCLCTASHDADVLGNKAAGGQIGDGKAQDGV